MGAVCSVGQCTADAEATDGGRKERPPVLPAVPDWYTKLPSAARPPGALPLAAFPRPPSDDGLGIHFGMDLRQPTLDAYMPRMQELHLKWTTIYAQDMQQGERAAVTAWNAGIMPVLRPAVRIDGAQPIWHAWVEMLKSHGIPPYVQIYNEPGDSREWKSGSTPSGYEAIFGEKWARAAAEVMDAGGYPGLQVLGKEELDAAIQAVKDSGRTDIWNRAFLSLHNYGASHPPAFPYDPQKQQQRPKTTVLDDDVCVLFFIELAIWMHNGIGFVLPMIGGEGGWQYGAWEDTTYPPVEGGYHAQYTVEMFTWFRTGILSNGQGLPDYLFAVSPWILFGWGNDDWYGGPLGDKTETLDAVRGMPTFVRKFSWDYEETP